MRNNKNNKYKTGKIIHIGLPFKSHDGELLKDRFMCVFSIEDDYLVLMPMSTFHGKNARNKKLKMLPNFEYSKNDGNTRDGYIKCNQLYFLNKEEYDNFDELNVSRRMKPKYFEKLQDYVENLRKNNKIDFFVKTMIFEKSDQLNKKVIINEAETNDYER